MVYQIQPALVAATLVAAIGAGAAEAPPNEPSPARVEAASLANTVAPDAESLASLLRRTLPQEPGVVTARALLEAASERELQARSRLGPSVGLQTTYGRSQERESGVTIDRTTDRSELSLRWNLYNNGNDNAEWAGSGRDVVAATEDFRRAREDAASRIADAYAEALRYADVVPKSLSRVQGVRRLEQQLRQQREAGKASDADALQVQAMLLDAEVAHDILLADQAAARERLAALAGGQVGGLLPVQLVPIPSNVTPGDGQTGAARERAEAARLRVRPLVSLFAPRIDLEYRRRLHDSTFPDDLTVTRWGWTLTARWEMPVLGENQARRAEGERRAEAVAAEADRVARTAASELATLPPRIAQAERAIAQLSRQIEQYEGLLKAGELQFEAGRRTLLQLIQVHDSLFSAEQRRAEQRWRLLSARLRQLALSGELLPAFGL